MDLHSVLSVYLLYTLLLKTTTRLTSTPLRLPVVLLPLLLSVILLPLLLSIILPLLLSIVLLLLLPIVLSLLLPVVLSLLPLILRLRRLLRAWVGLVSFVIRILFVFVGVVSTRLLFGRVVAGVMLLSLVRQFLVRLRQVPRGLALLVPIVLVVLSPKIYM